MTPELPVPEDDETTDTDTALPETAGTETTVPAGPTRRERRARSGHPAGAVQGPPPGQRYPVPAKGRDYAHRRRG